MLLLNPGQNTNTTLLLLQHNKSTALKEIGILFTFVLRILCIQKSTSPSPWLPGISLLNYLPTVVSVIWMPRALASLVKLYLLNTGQIYPTFADYLLQLKIIYFHKTGHEGMCPVWASAGLSIPLSSLSFWSYFHTSTYQGLHRQSTFIRFGS